MKIWIVIVLVLAAMVCPGFAQKAHRPDAKMCRVGDLTIKCPDYFRHVRDLNARTSLFKYYKVGPALYFFVVRPEGKLDYSRVETSIGAFFSPSRFKWKEVDDFLIMDMNTKHEKTLRGSLGFDGKNLLTLKSATFVIKGKPIVLGYVWNSNSGGAAEEFERGEIRSDNASGCNAIVDTLNSITNEFPGEKQYCTLTALGASPKK